MSASIPTASYLWNLRGFNISLEQDADCLLNNGVDAGLGVLINLVQTDVVLAVAGVAELRHGDGSSEAVYEACRL